MNFQSIKDILQSLVETLKSIEGHHYTQPIDSLSAATIGEHIRHIVELFQCLTNGYETGMVNYDNRERNKLMQTDINFAMAAIKDLINSIEKSNKPMQLASCFMDGSDEAVPTNYYRELIYNFEHCIHHQALIKVGLLELSIAPVTEHFGVAPSTIEYKKTCAQ